MSAMTAIEPPAAIGNAEAEAELCGALMLDAKLIDVIADKLNQGDFSDALFGRIFGAIVYEHSLGRPATPVTLKVHFAEDKAMNELGGAQAFLPQLTGAGANIGAAQGNADHIKALSRRRRLVDGLREALATAARPDVEIETVIADAETALAGAADDSDDARDLSGADCARQVIDGLSADDPPGVSSGLHALDETLGEIQPTDLIILGGRPGMAKSATAISYGLAAAARGHGVLFISLEMGAKQIGERELADLCFDSERRVPFSCITSRRISTEQGRELARAYERLQDLPIQVIDIGSSSIGRIKRLVRRHKRRFSARKQKLELVIVDYLQLVDANHKTASPYERISEVSRGLKSIAKSEEVGLMALCQLSRKVEERHDHRPQLSDLRDSGQIEQDADAVLFLLRPEYYLKKAEPSADDEEKYAKWQEQCSRHAGEIEFICAKRRRGSEGIGRGMFYGAYQAVR